MSTRTEATEGQAKIRQLLTDLRYGHFDSDAIGAINSMLDQALAILDASPPIGRELTSAEIERIVGRIGPIGSHLLGPSDNHGEEIRRHMMRALVYVRDHGYLAQAPQSSAPSVIEAGDAMENMMRRLRTQRDDEGILPTGNDFNGMDGLCAAWVAAKASRPSVTAPQGVTVDQIMKVVWTWAMDAKMVSATTEPYYLTNDLRSRLSALPTNPK